MTFGNRTFRVCKITYYTTCSCEKLKFLMEINGRVDRRKLANFKVIFDLFFFKFYSVTKI